MATPAKACNGQFSAETIQSLIDNTGRAQWLSQRCEVCGQQVGAQLVAGKWVPEQHWPSIQYPARSRRIEKRKMDYASARGRSVRDVTPSV